MKRRTRPALLAATLWVAMAAHAAPDAPDAPTAAPTAAPPPASPVASADAVLQMLQARGLVPAAAESEPGALVRQVRQVRDTASDLVLSAMNFLGVPYKRGGRSADDGFDCSGFTRHVFEMSLGLVLPRRADQQAHDAAMKDVQRNELKPGDLVFFNTMRRAFSHVGIYIGEGKFIHAPRTGGEVRIEDMRLAYWSQRFNGARRPDARTPAPAALAETPLRP